MKRLNQGVLGDLSKSVTDLDIESVKQKTRSALENGIPAKSILDALNDGMHGVGQKYETGEYFLTELVFAGQVLEAGIDVIKPCLLEIDRKTRGTIVAGTVKGDLHDLGKNLFLMLASAAGFTVEDLGTDVAAEQFVERAKKISANIVAVSALLSTTQPHLKDVVEALKRSGIRDKVRVIIGGAGITEKFGVDIGVDAAVNDAVKGVEACSSWMKSFSN